MTTRGWIASLLVISLGAAGAERLFACGDKYLNLGLGTHYHRSAAERRASAGVTFPRNFVSITDRGDPTREPIRKDD